jgi:hypothetical protein
LAHPTAGNLSVQINKLQGSGYSKGEASFLDHYPAVRRKVPAT